MKCPNCGAGKVSTVDSRPLTKNNGVRRRKVCDSCGHRWTTQEISQRLADFYQIQLQRSKELERKILELTTDRGHGFRWTEIEDKHLIHLYFENLSYREIAEIVSRPYKSVEGRIRRLRNQGKLII